MNPSIAQLMKSNPALAYALLGGGVGTTAVQGMNAQSDMLENIKRNLQGAVGAMSPSKEKLDALNASAGQAVPQTGNVNLGRAIVDTFSPDPAKLAALNAGGDVGVNAIPPASAPYNPAMAADPNAMSAMDKVKMMFGMNGGGVANNPMPSHAEMTADPMGNMMVAGTGNGLLGAPATGFNPAFAGPAPGMDDPNAMTPAMRINPTDDPNALTPALPAKRPAAKPMAAAPKPPAGRLNLSQANGGGTAPIPTPPTGRPGTEGPWGPNPTKAAWADGVQGGSWGAPDDRFVGAFANAAMPAQRGLLWPFS